MLEDGSQLQAREWDVVFTCFEPLVNVTGGIGTYHRLLINELAQAGKKVLILTREYNRQLDFPDDRVHVVNVDDYQTEKPWNFVGLHHEYFSLRCHFALKDLYERGHRFRFVEFSDYGSDGFYPLRARAAGVYSLGVAAVRLHSPNVMLVEDNGQHHFSVSQFNRDQIDREMSAFQDCDVVLYGGDAMLERVAGLTAHFGVDIRQKAVKCPHPYSRALFADAIQVDDPTSDRQILINKILKKNSFSSRDMLETARFVGVFGRIENRKGQYQFFDTLLRDPDFVSFLKQTDIHFVVAGHSVLDAVGTYVLGDLYRLIHDKELQGQIHFTGQVNQSVLARFSRAVDGYIFPSIFENYPNALLEVLPSTKPIAISGRGCMPEITEGFRSVTVFDPLELDISEIIQFLSALNTELDDVPQERARRQDVLEKRSREMLDYYTAPFSPGEPKNIDPSARKHTVGFVVPNFGDPVFLEETLQSIQKCLCDGDRIVVVDDGSPQEFSDKASEIAGAYGATFERLDQNAGPNAARLRGVRMLDCDLIQLCDSDDLLDAAGIGHARAAFSADETLTSLTGVMNCFKDAHHCWVPRNGYIWTAVEANFAHAGGLFRRDTLREALEKEDKRLPLDEDYFTNVLLLTLGGKCRMFPEITYHYRRFEGSRSTQNQSLVGAVQQTIMITALDLMRFTSPEQNARAREMLKRVSTMVDAKGNAVTAQNFPLRYQTLDAIFMRAMRLPFANQMMARLKSRWLRRKA
ncbi:MAG: hypothetical protein CSA85_00720 [Alphaproteobacteria bacterium]|nr:MAG: hypothetical protein CSA85_00720 [Alphaproteobacteria bacterium]